MRTALKTLCGLAIVVVLSSTRVMAHDLLLSTIDLVDNQGHTDVLVRTSLSHLARIEHKPGRAISAVEIDAAIRHRLSIAAGGATLTPGASEVVIDADTDLITWRAPFEAAPSTVRVTSRLFPEEPQSHTTVRFNKVTTDVQDTARLSAWRFVAMGIRHIFDGPDHIAFIIGLVLLGGSLRSLLVTVTAFTLAHSITLLLAVIGVLAPSPRLIEPLIALSIVAVAAENLLGRSNTRRRPYVAFVFGLVHGFGIAGPLRELGLGTSLTSLLATLAPFNVGVEIAQALIVLATWPMLRALSRHRPRAFARLSYAGALTISLAGGYWFVSRIAPEFSVLHAQSQPNADAAAARVTTSFAPFAPSVSTHHDAQFFYVESDGMPDHTMMVGIRAWQQQVPLPQNYRGNNAWRFPLFPKVAAAPLSAKDHFFRGAIAMAANGVPIFNPIKNDGVTDTFLAGELDTFGGHGGRADDYHYHLAPLHLQKVLGNATPVAYALDGYAILGLTEPDGSTPSKLDAFNGHIGTDGAYHYHATKNYPYLNGGFHGDVVERDGQVDPQPSATPVRPSGEPLRGAAITGFERLAGNSYTLTYTVRGETRKIRYTIEQNGRYVFNYIDGSGGTRTETYTAGRGRGGDNALPPTPPPTEGREGAANVQSGQRGRGGQRGGQAPGGGRGPVGVFFTDVPTHDVDVIAARPTANAITISVMTATDVEAALTVENGPALKSLALKAGVPFAAELTGLSANREYHYTVTAAGRTLATGSFHTARAANAAFTFAMQADSHLDDNTDGRVYANTLNNVVNDRPDFFVDLGDTFMTDKYPAFQDAARQYVAQRYYLGLVGRTAPVFMVLGNHDGEQGGARRDMTSWSSEMRRKYFPPVQSNSFYSAGPSSGNYYAWHWGDALFVVLDPFNFVDEKPRPGDGSWGWTLGKAQYDWLKRTLEASTSKYTFVFLHHLVGGSGDSARGGVEASKFFEWGGANLDGSAGFAAHRPSSSGWTMPIHDLLVKHHVSAVFHGHDHLYVRQERDGILYLEVAQPSHARGDNTNSAAGYGYLSGTLLGSSGHVRVSVAPTGATVEYVKSRLAGKNAEVVDRVVLKPSGGR